MTSVTYERVTQPEFTLVAQAPAPRPARRSRRAPVITAAGPWELTDHACASCLGRVLRSVDGTAYRCSVCGATADTLHGVCCCGMRFPAHRRDGTVKPGKLIGVRCIPNPRRSAMSPAEIIATEA